VCGQALIKFYALLPFFLNVDLVFFFSFWKNALRYVTLRAAQQPPPKMRFFRKNNRLHNTRAPSQKEKKGELFTRARARKEEEEEEEEERSARAFEKKTP